MRKKREYTKNCINWENSFESGEAPFAIIDHLLNSNFNGKYSETVIKEQIETVLIAGSDTSAIAISFSILMLAMHPEIQERLYNELHTNYYTQTDETTFEQLRKLPFLECCLKETLRLFPVAALIGRTSDVDIPISNCVIPKHTIIALSIVTLHRVGLNSCWLQFI